GGKAWGSATGEAGNGRTAAPFLLYSIATAAAARRFKSFESTGPCCRHRERRGRSPRHRTAGRRRQRTIREMEAGSSGRPRGEETTEGHEREPARNYREDARLL
ncbi:unnamed protein product, partial [Urochloa humidicola]